MARRFLSFVALYSQLKFCLRRNISISTIPNRSGFAILSEQSLNQELFSYQKQIVRIQKIFFFQCYAIIIVMLEMFLWPEELFVFIAVIGLWRDKAEVEEDGDRSASIIQALVFLTSGWFQIKLNANYFVKLFSSLEVDRSGAEQTEPKSL